MTLMNFYNGKKVLITGHTGFKGSWLSLWLVKMGAKVTGIALEPKTNSDNFVQAKVSELVEHNMVDIRNFEKLKSLVNNVKPDIIFHFAAQPLVLEGYQNPYETFETNFLGTLNILEIFKNSENIESLIIITTDKVYLNQEWLWGYREIDTLGGEDPYSASKASVELLTSSYFQSFIKKTGRKLATVRAGNVIGGGDWSAHRIIPDFFRAKEAGVELEIRNPYSVRPWQFVLEPLFGYLLLGEKLSEDQQLFSTSWNFGPDKDKFVNVKSLIEHLLSINPGMSYKILENQNSHKETNFLFLDSMKAYKYLCWRSILTFQETLELTSDWYNNYRLTPARDICLAQIDLFETKWKLNN